MGKQTKHRHANTLTDQSAELPEELRALVEKRTGGDRRTKDRRGGPPRRSLSESAAKGEEGTLERRKTPRRTTATRRGKPRRR